MKFALLILALFGYSSALGECLHHQITIAVIDTGFGFQGRGKDAKLCDLGHRDFSNENWFHDMGPTDLVPFDKEGHGTNIVGLIDKYAKPQK